MAYPCCNVTKTLLISLKINPRWRTVGLCENISQSKNAIKILGKTSIYCFSVSFK